ncbi:MAG: metallophosphoesterase [Clostridia bacterium]|nr:metallophosphoesterase [Clostridia bacterium]
MAVFAIGDLHLPGGDDKPMNVFGAHWEGHFDRIRADWVSKVGDEDIVLIPGDISWAMQVEQALPDLMDIGALPGKKILLRGNHDYWWCGITRLRELLPPGMYAVQNDALLLDDIALCGTRGWTLPTPGNAEDEKIYSRELLRMEMSLDRAKQLNGRRLIVMCHYPPLGEGGAKTRLSALLEKYMPDDVVYGHLHGPSLRGAVTGCIDGIRYHCVSCDGLGFRVYRLPDGPVGPTPTEGSEGAD